MIESLTPEQESRMPTYVKKWIDIAFSTDEIDIEKSLNALRIMYAAAGLEFPDKYEVYDSPRAAQDAMLEKYGVEVSGDDFWKGIHDCDVVGRSITAADYFLNETEVEFDENSAAKAQITLAQNCGWCLMMDEVVVLTRRPSEFITGDDGKVTLKYIDGNSRS